MALSANFLTELDKLQFKANLVLKIDGTYFSQYQPDSGLVVDSDKVGLVDDLRTNGVTLDIRRPDTPIATADFRLLDKDGIISSFMGNSPTQLQRAEVEVYFGYRTGSFDFSDYALLAVTQIRNITKIQNAYNFSSKETTDLMQRELLNTRSSLDAGITSLDTTLDLVDATDFPNSGRIKIDNEFIQYTGKTVNQLTGLSRGDLSTTAESHDQASEVFLVTEKDDHILNILLDVLLNDLGIDPSLIDQDSITDARDGEFSGEPNQVLYIYDIDNALKWIESRILASTNGRLFSSFGEITFAVLDQVPRVGTDLPEINEDHIQSNPSWKINSDRIVNKVIVNWFYSEASSKFARQNIVTDDDSIATYELRTPVTLNLYGVQDLSVALNRAQRMLTRLSTPKASISATTHFNRLRVGLADQVRFIHRYLPQQGGGLGFNDTLEVMSRSISGYASDAKIRFGLEFSSYTGIRIGLIAPYDPLVGAINSQRQVEVADGACYGVGYTLRLYDNVNDVYFSDPINVVESISGNILTFKDDFITTLGPNTSLRFTTYDNASGDQRAKYAYIAPNTGVFSIDGSKAYQIIF